MSDYVKDPLAVLEWVWDWTAWLATSETISTIVITVSAGINLDSSSHTTNTATAWLSGGSSGQVYNASCKITTNQARTDKRTVQIRVISR